MCIVGYITRAHSNRESSMQQTHWLAVASAGHLTIALIGPHQLLQGPTLSN